jgi:hypothetical protein
MGNCHSYSDLVLHAPTRGGRRRIANRFAADNCGCARNAILASRAVSLAYASMPCRTTLARTRY